MEFPLISQVLSDLFWSGDPSDGSGFCLVLLHIFHSGYCPVADLFPRCRHNRTVFDGDQKNSKGNAEHKAGAGQ